MTLLARPSLQPKSAFSRFPPVHRADLEGQQRVDLNRSSRGPRMTALCAKGTDRRLGHRNLLRLTRLEQKPNIGAMDSRDWLAHYPFFFVRIACLQPPRLLSSCSTGREVRTGDQPTRPDGPFLLRLDVAGRGAV